ncbi:hypothetical protein LSUE1_G008240 [Lachnellula suecica]|uniref:Asl1-like glycosyl hydrolase catalytic domain-containing protein n=1 Tax=Lachnellula suecica TaxID=602035 RepID=A0A8T9C4G7_9HELO|nr:hypothetical protein LSUE1_G008240 [Lachnellula suecica]
MQLLHALYLAALASAAPTTKSRRFTTDAPFGNKKGLAYNSGADTSVLSTTGSATWAYNWGAARNAPKFQQIPMVWGPGSEGDQAGALASYHADPNDTPWVLGYNEPDETGANGGCNASPQAAYNAWGDDMFQFSDLGIKLVCPAITSWDTTNGATGGPSGLTWLRDFASIGNNPSQFRCSAQALHWYGTNGQTAQQQADSFIGYIESASSTVNNIFGTNMLLWITEFSPLPVNDAQLMADFLDIAMPWLDNTNYIDRYSPFMADYMVTNGALNVAGQHFVKDS